MRQMKEMRIEIPPKAKKILNTIHAAGFEAYVVGGCVRDSILGRSPADWDITTSALPEQVKALFPHTIDTGIAHGTVTVMMEKEGFEVTTYRIDGKYEDSRHPKEVLFTPSLEEDLKRRDFTINAMAYNEEEGLVDIFCGIEDIQNGLIRCVGTAAERFTEDALRIMRAVRFSAQLGYEIEEHTREAIVLLAPTLEKISAERIQVELIKLLTSNNPGHMKIVYETGIGKILFPEFHESCLAGEGELLFTSLELSEGKKEIRLGLFLQFLDKLKVREVMRRLRMDNKTTVTVMKLVEFQEYGMDQAPSAEAVRRLCCQMGPENMEMLLELRRAKYTAMGQEGADFLSKLPDWKALFQEVMEQNQPYSLKSLAVTGKDLMDAGVPAGKEIGEALDQLLEIVLQCPEKNQRELLLQEALKKTR